MRRKGRQVDEEGRILALALNVPHRLIEKYVGRESLVAHPLPVPQHGVVELGVAPVVVDRAGAAAVDRQRFLETAVFGRVPAPISDMPLPEQGRSIPGRFEPVGHRRHVGAQDVLAAGGHGDPRPQRVQPRHQRRARRAAERMHVEVHQPDAFVGQPVDVRRLHHGIPRAAQITVSLVIRHDEDDVGTLSRNRGDAQYACRDCSCADPIPKHSQHDASSLWPNVT